MLDALVSVVNRLADSTNVPGLNWKGIVLSTLAVHFSFDFYVKLRQLRVLRQKKLPKDVEHITDQETFSKSQDYGHAKLQVALVEDVVELLLTFGLYKFDVLPKTFSLAERFVSRFGFSIFTGEITTSVVFQTILAVAQRFFGLPFSLYRTFVVEERFGFNKQTIGLYCTDLVKSLLVFTPLMGIFMAIMIKTVYYFGRSFFVYLTLIVLAIQLVMMVLVPVVINPIFNSYRQLEEGELRQRINKLAGDLKFPLTRVYVEDSSKRSAHSNAYFIGMPWYKQIVLFDNLIENVSTDGIIAVLAHELGHWKRNHLPKLVATSMSVVLVMFSVLAVFVDNQSLYTSLGFVRQKPVIVAFLVFQDIIKPIEAPVQFMMHYVTRVCEYDADRFAVDLGHGENLAKALITMHKTDLGTLTADSVYSTYTFSHPILPERLHAINARLTELNEKKR